MLPQIFWTYTKIYEKQVPGPKGRFSKKKKEFPGMHMIYKCAKFQHNWVILYFSMIPKRFKEKRAGKIFKK